MKKSLQVLSFFLVLFAGMSCVQAQSAVAAPRQSNPWNGTWRLDVKRSSAGAADDGVPHAYRLTLGAAGPAVVPIRWEIPEFREIVSGETDGKPMRIQRTHPTPGLTLAIRTEGEWVLTYQVLKDGRPVGDGRMTLIDDGKAWIDITWPSGKQGLASELVYEKE